MKRTLFQKARKDHVCDVCGFKILKGEKYWRGRDDGPNGLDDKTHTNCELFQDDEHRVQAN